MMRSERSAPISRARKIRGDRLGLVYALLLVAEAGVLALAWQSERAIERQREIVERNLVEFANFGATNFAYRAGSALANHARIFHESVSGLGNHTDAALLAAGRGTLDSLEACQCEAAQHVVTLSLLNGQGQVIAASNRGPLNVPELPKQAVATLMAKGRSNPAPEFAVRLTDEAATPSVLALSRVAPSGTHAERFLVASYDLNDVRLKMFNYIYKSRPTLLPSVFGAQRRNDAIIAVRVVLPGGHVLYTSPNADQMNFKASVPFGPDTLVRVQAVLMPDVATEMMKAADGSFRSVWVVLVTGVATLVIGLIALMTRRAAQLSTLRGDFTAAVSHELRTPLTEIMLYAELILAGKTVGPVPTRTAAQVILAEARRLYQLVENVLVIARTDRRMLRVRLGEQDLVPIVRDTITGFGPLADKRSVRITEELPATATAMCDPSAVAGILTNLLENAVRYGPEAQTVIVRVRVQDSGRVSFEVDDAGPGIPVQDRTRVCESYVRLERDVDANTSGSGLGLAVVSALVSTMNGTLEIGSSSRGGALVRVELPGV